MPNLDSLLALLNRFRAAHGCAVLAVAELPPGNVPFCLLGVSPFDAGILPDQWAKVGRLLEFASHVEVPVAVFGERSGTTRAPESSQAFGSATKLAWVAARLGVAHQRSSSVVALLAFFGQSAEATQRLRAFAEAVVPVLGSDYAFNGSCLETEASFAGHSTMVATRRLRILVVDDEPAVRRSLRRVLPAAEVVLADDVEHALSLIAGAEDFDVVLCDLMMPSVSGAAFFRAVCRVRPSLKSRFIFMTGGAMGVGLAAEADLSAVPMLSKPFGSGLLTEMLERITGKRPSRP